MKCKACQELCKRSDPYTVTLFATFTARKSFTIRTYKKCVRKPFRIRSCKNTGLKVPWNEQLQKSRGVPPPPCLLQIFVC